MEFFYFKYPPFLNVACTQTCQFIYFTPFLGAAHCFHNSVTVSPEPTLLCQVCANIITTSKEPGCPRVELILKIIIILLIIFLGFIKSKPC